MTILGHFWPKGHHVTMSSCILFNVYQNMVVQSEVVSALPRTGTQERFKVGGSVTQEHYQQTENIL